jgi:glycosyltransferase involved in cell wall biosynthesis
MPDRTVVYLQYTNPAVYPPVQHSAGILAEAGWNVIVLGISVPDVARLEFPIHPRIELRLANPSPSGWSQKIHYLRFCGWALGWILRRRAAWVYASDALTSPIGWLASYFPGVRVVYHEHDSPARGAQSPFMQRILAFRRRLLRRAAVVVAPNAERGRLIAEDAGTRTPIAVVSAWNCPRKMEAAAPRRQESTREAWVVYQGSIVPARVPRALVEALALVNPCVKLRVIGYETAGHVGYIDELERLATAIGVSHRVEFIPTVPRNELLQWTDRSQIGLSLMPVRTEEINERWMRGASNKTFEYLARGVPVLVSDLPEWKASFVDTGFGCACTPDDPRSIATALGWFHEHRDKAREMGERGRQRILTEWNYERQFDPVLRLMTAMG